jgi:hypothetical protein
MNELVKLRPHPKVLHQIGGYSPLMSIRFVVEVYHVTLWIKLGFISDVVFDSIDMGKGLHAKLAVESSAKGVENLILLLGAVPNIPLMHIWRRVNKFLNQCCVNTDLQPLDRKTSCRLPMVSLDDKGREVNIPQRRQVGALDLSIMFLVIWMSLTFS